MSIQLGLYDVLAVFDDDPLSNTAMYERLSEVFGVSDAELNQQSVVDHTGRKASLAKRRIRWHQQSLKHAGLVQGFGSEKVSEEAIDYDLGGNIFDLQRIETD